MSTRAVHVITGLGVGGAESMLAKLLEAEVAAERVRTVEVICLGPEGPMAARIHATGIPVTFLNMGPGGGVGGMRGLRALAARLRSLNPDVVQCWMYHADLVAGVVASIVTPHSARIWSIRASSMPSPATVRTRTVIRICALLSWIVPRRIISCSGEAARLHVRMGYSARRIVVIPNGFDLRRFQPDLHAKSSLQAELGLPDTSQLIGCVARFDTQKDFPTLFRAFARVAKSSSCAVLVIAGRGCAEDNADIVSMIPGDLRDRVKLLGMRTDIPRITAALDVAVLTSAYGEGFPNVLGEALACGVPCVATDVGDAREIAGDEGVIAPVGDFEALARGVSMLLSHSADVRRSASERMRERAIRMYDLRSIAQQYWTAQDESVAVGRLRVTGSA